MATIKGRRIFGAIGGLLALSPPELFTRVLVDQLSIMRKKVVLIGPSGSGKTEWLRRATGRPRETVHVPTLGVDVVSVGTWTPAHPLVFEIWDTGSNQFKGLGDGYWVGADAAVVFGRGSEATAYEVAFAKAHPGVPVFRSSSDIMDTLRIQFTQ